MNRGQLRCAALAVVLLEGLVSSAARDTSPGEGASGRPADRAISWKLLLPNVVHDQKPIWLFPKAVAQRRRLAPTIAVISVTAALVALDPHDTPYFRRTQTFGGFNQGFSGRNTAIGTAIVPLSFYFTGLARKDSYAERTALLAAEAVGDAEILTWVMKNVDRRRRPAEIPPGGDFGNTWFRGRGTLISGRGSFPSGHTIAAFSVATVLADRYPCVRWHRWVAFGLAGLVGFSRVTLQSHFPSDVFAGAALGYVIGHYAVLRRS